MSQLWDLIGGAEGTRTPDPLHAKQVLSQLSYSPTIDDVNATEAAWCSPLLQYLLQQGNS